MNMFTLLKSSTEYKPVKAKGEIIDEYWKVTLVKHFTDIKEPDAEVDVYYTSNQKEYHNLPDRIQPVLGNRSRAPHPQRGGRRSI